MREKTKNVILYLIGKLGSKIEGRKKLMKLMFLIEHFDLESGRIVRKHTLGNRFFIYYYGVFSFDVMNSYEELIREGKIGERCLLTSDRSVMLSPALPSENHRRVEIRLDEELRRVVDGIIEKFGDCTGYDLEVKTLRMLGIEPFEKDQYFGKEVDEVLKEKCED